MNSLRQQFRFLLVSLGVAARPDKAGLGGSAIYAFRIVPLVIVGLMLSSIGVVFSALAALLQKSNGGAPPGAA